MTARRRPRCVVPRLWTAPIGRVELRRVAGPAGQERLWQARCGVSRWPGSPGARTPMDALSALLERQRADFVRRGEDMTLMLDDFLPPDTEADGALGLEPPSAEGD